MDHRDDNPYRAPSLVADYPDDDRRPLGVTILSVLFGIFGLALLGMYVFLLMYWREHNAAFIREHRMAPSIFWVLMGVFVIVVLAGSVGMWRGAKWGWWIGCFSFTNWVLSNGVSFAGVNLAAGMPSFEVLLSLDSLKYAIRGIIAALLLSYWMRLRVRRYYGLERTSRIKAIAIVLAVGFLVICGITGVLQTAFLLSRR